MKIKDFEEKMEVPEGVQATIAGSELTVKGPKAELKRKFETPRFSISTEGSQIVFRAKEYTKKDKTLLGTFKAHIRNMFKGATEGHEYVLKVCSGHFPMNVDVKDGELRVKNLLGEKIPRVYKFSKDVDVKVEGDMVHVTGNEKEKVAQTAASIEQLTRRSNFDRRIFQDGIYIVNKDGKEIKA